MSVTGALARGRRAAEVLMTDTVLVKRPGTPVEGAGGVVTTAWTLVDAGKGRISGDRPYEQNPQAAGHAFTVQRYILSKPVTSGPYLAGDVVKVTASASNPQLVGRLYRIAAPDLRSQQTSLRMFVEDYNGEVVGFDD